MRREIPKFWQSDLSKGHFLLKTGPLLSKPRLFARAVAFLELLAGAAGAWVVAPNFGTGADDLLDGGLLGSAASHFGLLEFALFLALELVFDLIDRSGNAARGTATATTERAAGVWRSSIGRACARRRLRAFNDLH